MSATISGWDPAAVEAIIDSLKHKPGALMPVLHEIQHSQGYVPSDAVPMIAEKLQLTRADVHGVITFYRHFYTTPPAKHTIQICRAEACQSMGSRELEEHAKKVLGIDYHQKTADGRFALEPVYCVGNCACAPSVATGEHGINVHARMSKEKFSALVDELSADAVEIK